MNLLGVEHHSGPELTGRTWATQIIKNKDKEGNSGVPEGKKEGKKLGGKLCWIPQERLEMGECILDLTTRSSPVIQMFCFTKKG